MIRQSGRTEKLAYTVCCRGSHPDGDGIMEAMIINKPSRLTLLKCSLAYMLFGIS